ncbi:MAG TPA: hypothetical protein VG456_19165 [Candidatus Sulfopaludibacter sp.]|jgi:hypothetical protein|nr:hypothetical protein [Candidatus Sulfopaludibacter sp.]
MNRRDFCLSLAGLRVALSAERSTWDQTGQIRFVLTDRLDHPFYYWPRTLLAFPIDFRQSVELNRLVLKRADTGETVPIQFADVVHEGSALRSATLHFFSDLPSGASREFVLSAGAAPVVHAPQVREVHEGDTIILDSGAMRVRIPASQTVRGDVPGPIMQVSRGGAWMGASKLSFADGKVTRIVTRRVADGPLYLAFEMTYESEGGSRYVARLQCNGGFEFVRLQEDMEGLRPGVQGAFTSTWTGFDVTHRQAPNHPVPLMPKIGDYDSYSWEKIDEVWRGRDIIMGSSRPIYFESPPQGELPFCLGIFQSWPAYHVLTNANFWNQRTGDALGVFIDKVNEWQDHEYAYEVESTALQVRFHYQDKRFWWHWPLTRGRRSTCLAFYDHEKDKDAMHEFERATGSVVRNGLTYQVGRAYTSHTLWLQNRYGTIDLNSVKDWVLEYPETGRRAPLLLTTGTIHDPAELERVVMTSGYACTLPVLGARENGGSGPIPGRNIVSFSPVPSRQVQGSWVGGFNASRAAMNERQRRRLTAMFLFLGYVHAGDDYMPVVPMLGGHPNFLADVKAGLASMAFLFPDHPMAPVWADHWQKCMQLNARFNTRPAVKAWDAQGGRWTENLGTYVWAFLHPCLHTAFLLRQYDGVERFVSPQIADLALWLVNALSAPFNGETEEAYRVLQKFDGGREWDVVAPGKGPRRVYAPQGSHSERRMPPASLWHLGKSLQRYAPLAAEYAMWATRSTNQESETSVDGPNPWEKMYNVPDNLGTNPHLRSSKFTGYGVVLRAGVGADEVSVHLQQIDESPNYRWGRAGEGGCGVLYYFAAGKAYSMNGPEDTGDRIDQDTDFCTNFGVYKAGQFRSIGMNVLSRPLYDLGAGQFAEIVPRDGASAYSAPEYVSRSILLAGHEYFVVYDEVLDASIHHRLSWFVRRGEELPTIKLTRGADGNRESQRTNLQTDSTLGVWFDGVGDSMAVVSHRPEIEAEAALFGARVRIDGMQDLVFRNPQPVEYADGETVFRGTAGLIRTAKDRTEFALFHGTRIGVPGIEFQTRDTELGIGGSVVPGKAPCGEFYAPKPSSVSILSATSVFYVDGEARTGRRESGALWFDLEQGRHHWELTERLPVPIAPGILRTENHAGGARVYIAPVAGATEYRVELSRDSGATWTAQPSVDIGGLRDGEKVHVRAVARNAENESQPGPEYPIYVTREAPLPPDGVHVELAAGAATVSWGEVLGVSEYRLYVRRKGTREFQLLHRGLDRVHVDRRTAIRPCDAIPGQEGTAEIWEYAVTASNGNGEGVRSQVADTDPASWRNWNPRPGERFRRLYSGAPVYPPQPNAWPRYYPE